MKRRAGFTLIEVLVALAILSVMTVLTAGAIQNAVRSREKMSGTMSREASVRDALRVIERDINSAFHFREIAPELQPPVNPQTAGQPGALGGTQPGVIPPPVLAPTTPQNQVGIGTVKLTQFIGERERIDFTALSHVRVIQDAAESDQSEVGYYLAPCRSRSGKRAETNCLWRREALEIDDDVTKGGEAIVVIENVETLRFRYLGPKKPEWQESWKTDRGGDDATRDNFPYAVEIQLKVFDRNDPNAKAVAMTSVAEIRFPNNAPPRRPDQQPGAPGGATTPPPPPPTR